MLMFNEDIKARNTTYDINFLTVPDFQEIYFDVYELVINGNKYIAEKVSEYQGMPVVTIPVTINSIAEDASFVLKKGTQEVLFNKNNSLTYSIKQSTDSDFLDSLNEDSISEISNLYIDSEAINEELKKAKLSAAEYAKDIKEQKIEEATQAIERKKKDAKKEIESYKKDLLSEFYGLTEDIRSSLHESNAAEQLVIRKNVSETLEILSEELDTRIEKASEEVKKFYDNKIKLIEESVLDITRKQRDNVIAIINESKQSLLDQINTITVPQSSVIVERDGKSTLDLKELKKEIEKKITAKFSAEMGSLKRYIELSSGGGSVAQQFSNGGTMNGSLTVTGTISASQYLGIVTSTGNEVYIGGNSVGANMLIGTNDNFNLNIETAGTTKMTVTSTGSVGIGTTAPSTKLEVTGNGRFTGTYPYIDLKPNGWSNPFYFQGGVNIAGTGIGDYTLFLNPVEKGFAFNQGSVSRFVVDASTGNLGIGRATPLAKLDVNGTTFINATGDGGTGAMLTVGGTGSTIYTPGSIWATGGLVLSAGNNVSQVAVNGGNIVNVNGLQIASGGPVLSYVSSTGIKVLQANGTTYGSVNAGTLALGSSYAGVAAPTNGAIIEGNLGIGTTTPSSKLEVVGSIGKFNVTVEGYATSMTRSNSNLRFAGFNIGIISFMGTADGYTTQQTGALINSLTEGSGGDTWQLRPSANLCFHTTPNSSGAVLTERIRITGEGNVGIGTTTPAARLHIADTTLAGSGSLAGSVLNLAQTWNTTGNPTAIKLNVTNTASGATSNLLDLQIGGSNRFRVDKDGVTTIFGTFNTCTLKITQIGSNQTNGFGPFSANAILAYANGARTMLLGYGGGYTDLRLTAGHRFGWTSDSFSAAADLDTILVRDAANIVAMRNGVNPQAFRLYNTYTDATTFERLNIKWDTNVLKIGTEKGSVGGDARDLAFETAAATRMTVTSAGSVGIGTTTPSTLLHIHKDQTADTELRVQNSSDLSSATATINLVGSQGSTLVLQANSTTVAAPDATRALIKATSNVFGINFKAESAAGTLQFYTGGGAAANERLRITAAGNVGIGTITPQLKLDVNGEARFGNWLYVDRTSGSLTSYLGLKVRGAAEGGNYGNPAGNGPAEINFTGVSGLVIGSNQALPIIFASTNLERLRILANGNVGIGTTSPSTLLHLRGGVSPTIKIEGYDAGATYLYPSISFQSNNNQGNYESAKIEGYGYNPTGFNSLNFFISDSVGVLRRMWQLDSLGNLVQNPGGNGGIPYNNTGIQFVSNATGGTGSRFIQVGTCLPNGHPGEMLKIKAGDANYAATGGLNFGGKIFVYGGKAVSTNATPKNGDVILAHDGTTPIGNVGIGTTAPNSKLTVTGGDIEITDTTAGVIFKTPDGTKRYRMTIDNAGAPVFTLLP